MTWVFRSAQSSYIVGIGGCARTEAILQGWRTRSKPKQEAKGPNLRARGASAEPRLRRVAARVALAATRFAAHGGVRAHRTVVAFFGAGATKLPDNAQAATHAVSCRVGACVATMARARK